VEALTKLSKKSATLE
jgi:hypothetical protein